MTSPGRKVAKLVRCLAQARYRRALLLHRVAAGTEHEHILRQLADCDMVVDIGANKGQFALVVRECLPSARVLSFEPLGGPAARFTALFANDPLTTLHLVAIGPKRGTGLIHLSAREDSSSLLPIAEAQNELFPGTAETGTLEVRVARLGDIINRSDVGSRALLKLDVQGFELQALEGCGELLAEFAYVYVECSFVELYSGQSLAPDVIHWLHQRQFDLQGAFNTSYDKKGRAIQADFLFSHSSVGSQL
jgi:FkbM family methyltransferase